MLSQSSSLSDVLDFLLLQDCVCLDFCSVDVVLMLKSFAKCWAWPVGKERKAAFKRASGQHEDGTLHDD
eukprot:144207-Rhodomonas_salina.1